MTDIFHGTSRVSSAVTCDPGARSRSARLSASCPPSCVDRRVVVVRGSAPPPGRPCRGIRQGGRRRSHRPLPGCGSGLGGVRGGGPAPPLRYRLARGRGGSLRLRSPRPCRRRACFSTVVSAAARGALLPRGRWALLVAFHRGGHGPVTLSRLRAFARSDSPASPLPGRQPRGTVPALSMPADRRPMDPWFSVSVVGSDGTR
jgi:hypothetical protein